jgi:Lon protease-like protein
VADRIPLFPLSAVLFPGVSLPLHIFEERYRLLVRRLLEQPEGETRAFGVVAIRVGRESGDGGVTALHEVGCLAELRGVEPHEDGQFDLAAAGTRRFRLLGVDSHEPYLSGEVEWLAEPEGDAAGVLAVRVAQRFEEYRDILHELGLRGADSPLPRSPTALSYRIATSTVMDLSDRQALLAAPDTAARLGLELDLLRRESGLLKELPSLPAVEFTRQPAPPN